MKSVWFSPPRSAHVLLIVVLTLTACNGGSAPSATPTDEPTATIAPTRAPEATPSERGETASTSPPTETVAPPPTASATYTATPAPSATLTPTLTATATRRPPSTAVVTRTPTPPPTLTYTPTPNCIPPEFFDPFLNRCRLPDQPTPNPGDVDADGDGYTPNQGDCNDADPTIHPGAPDPPDDIDSDCDGDPFG
jgi:hypothetical protein